MLDNLSRSQSAEDADTVLRNHTNVAICLIVPVWEARLLGKVFSLVNESTAQASGINFLQSNKITIIDQLGNSIEISLPLRIWEYVFPTVSKVVPITPGCNPTLDVVTEQAQVRYTVYNPRCPWPFRCKWLIA